MPIKDDLSGLPSDRDTVGFPPVGHPILVPLLAEAWYEDYLAGDEHVPSARWWASLSGMCARSVGYTIREGDAKRALLAAQQVDDASAAVAASLEVEDRMPTNPPGIAEAWRFGLGTMVHDRLQAVLPKAFPGAEIEVRVTIDDFGSAHVDAVIDELDVTDPDKPYRTVLELKTINGFGYKAMATGFKGAPEGPRRGAVIQGAVAAVELEADRLIVGYLSLECLSPAIATQHGMDEVGRFAAEWHFAPEEFTPIAEAELRRVRKIIALVDEGELPPRHTPEIPARARITDPRTGQWTVTNAEGAVELAGKTWVCGYCWNRDRCTADGPS